MDFSLGHNKIDITSIEDLEKVVFQINEIKRSWNIISQHSPKTTIKIDGAFIFRYPIFPESSVDFLAE